MSFPRWLAFFMVFTSTLFAQSIMHLSGLDRLYFEHVGDSENL
jgi:hypothetical protein